MALRLTRAIRSVARKRPPALSSRVLCSNFQQHSFVQQRFLSEASDADFMPQKKTPPESEGVAAIIQKDIDSAEVFLFMKGVPQAPQCGFSNQVCQVLNHIGVEFKARNILLDPVIREGVKAFSKWPTIPQLYVKGEFVGGCDIVTEMFREGELEQLFKDNGIKLIPKAKEEEAK